MKIGQNAICSVQSSPRTQVIKAGTVIEDQNPMMCEKKRRRSYVSFATGNLIVIVNYHYKHNVVHFVLPFE